MDKASGLISFKFDIARHECKIFFLYLWYPFARKNEVGLKALAYELNVFFFAVAGDISFTFACAAAKSKLKLGDYCLATGSKILFCVT